MAASGTTNLAKVLEQVDVEDAPGDTADPLDTGINLIWLLWMYKANLSQCFLLLAWLLIALSPMLDSSI